MDRLEEYNIECMLINDNQAKEDELIKEYERNSMDRLISKEEIERLENIVYRYNRESRGWHDCNDIRLNSNDIKAIEKAIELVKAIPSAEQKVGRCEDCKHFRKLPLRTDTVGKCIQHWGVCPPCDWYCADFEPQESEE